MLNIPNSKEIQGFVYCTQCLHEAIAKGEAPLDYQRIEFGMTPVGLQLWCRRHDCNVMHIHFDGRPMQVNVSKYVAPVTIVAMAEPATPPQAPSDPNMN